MKRIETKLILFISDKDFERNTHPVHEAIRYVKSGDAKEDLMMDGYMDVKITTELQDLNSDELKQPFGEVGE